ncbi:MAG: hypothetical protein WAW85_07710 [Gordonia sp. (in: high G+C Gram-positive bacteria)]|uniref:hypothetical protein n=1 Tax=Gordonia sp. (in: high G+C Gram-positive bacteria) TaxID=84139 RepID=UPI003BB59F52
MTAIQYPPETVVTIGRSLYIVEATRPCKSRRPQLRGKTVFSLLKVCDGTRWRLTATALDRSRPVCPTYVGRTTTPTHRRTMDTMANSCHPSRERI